MGEKVAAKVAGWVAAAPVEVAARQGEVPVAVVTGTAGKAAVVTEMAAVVMEVAPHRRRSPSLYLECSNLHPT